MANSRMDIPSLVDPKHLQANGKLIADEDIAFLKSIIDDEIKKGDANLYISRTKIGGNFGITHIEGQNYAIYFGKKHNKHIGAGAFGVVKYLQNLETGEWLAMKVLKKRDASLAKEVGINQLVGLGVSAAYERATKHGTKKYEFVMTLAPGKEMTEIFDDRLNPDAHTIPLTERLQAAIEVVREVDRIHQLGILHRDLKPGNMFYDQKTHKVTILDFGMAEKMDHQHQVQDHFCGTPDFLPPEVRLGKLNIYSTQSDAYAVGVILAEVLGFSLKQNEASELAQLTFHHSDYLPIDTAKISNPEASDMARLINALINKDPGQRPELAVVQAELQRILNNPKADYLNALIKAVESNDKNAINLALKNARKQNRRFDMNDVIDMRGNLLHIAALQGSDIAIQVLVDNGANINARNPEQNTALHLVAGNKSAAGMKVIKVLRENEIEIDATNNKGDTALHIAASSSNVAVVSKLIKELPDCSIINHAGETAADIAKNKLVPSAEAKAIAQLVQPDGLGTRLDVGLFKKTSTSAIVDALQKQDRHPVQALTKQLHDAIQDRDYEKVDALLASGADVNLAVNGLMALNIATKPYDSYLIKLLLVNDANVNQLDGAGQTVLHHAAEHRDKSLLDLLLIFPDLDVAAVNSRGETAAHIAAIHNDTDFLMKFLDSDRVDIAIMEHQDNDGLTPQEILELHDENEKIKPYEPTSEQALSADVRNHVANKPADFMPNAKSLPEVEDNATPRRPGFGA